jgi:hypothetical protein
MPLFRKKKQRDRDGPGHKDDKAPNSHRRSIAASNEDLPTADQDVRLRTSTDAFGRRPVPSPSFLPSKAVGPNVVRSNTSYGKTSSQSAVPRAHPNVPPPSPSTATSTEAKIGQRLSLELKKQGVSRPVGRANGIDDTVLPRPSLTSQTSSDIPSPHDELKEALKEVIRLPKNASLL